MIPYRVKRHRKRAHKSGVLALVPFIDMMTILVVFLLLHTADVDILPNTKNISIPQSVSEIKPHETVVVMITKDMLYVGGEAIATMADVAATDGTVIAPLKAALSAQADRIVRSGDVGGVAGREVTIMGDKATPYHVLKKIMATCTTADFGKVSLAVMEKERSRVVFGGRTTA